MEKLTNTFLDELFAASLKDRKMFDIVQQHLVFEYLPTEPYKRFWNGVLSNFKATQSIPSYGVLAQQFANDLGVLEVIGNIREVRFLNNATLITQFESYIRSSRFVKLYNELGELWENGNREKALSKIEEDSKQINGFSLTSKRYTKIFGDFDERVERREKDREESAGGRFKIPTCITPLDEVIRGGLDRGDTLLFTAQSGAGKTKFLRWLGANAANFGLKVVHLQGEGTSEECQSGYDATWTGMSLHKIRTESFGPEVKRSLKQRAKHVLIQGGEVYVEAFEQFGRANMTDVRLLVADLIAEMGQIDLILLDYLEKFQPSGNYNWKPSEERPRREKIAEQFKDLCVEFGCTGATATQASTVSPVQLNNPNFVMTRFNISEFKALINPFSFHITFNQTDEEYQKGLARLYVDKFRNYKAQQIIPIAQDYDREQFYDRRRTIRELLNT